MATALADRTKDFNSIKVVVKSVDALQCSNCQYGEPNEEITIRNKLELEPEINCHFSICRLTLSSKLRQYGFLKVPVERIQMLISQFTLNRRGRYTL